MADGVARLLAVGRLDKWFLAKPDPASCLKSTGCRDNWGLSLAGCRDGTPFIARHAFRSLAAEALPHALAGNLTPLISHN